VARRRGGPSIPLRCSYLPRAHDCNRGKRPDAQGSTPGRTRAAHEVTRGLPTNSFPVLHRNPFESCSGPIPTGEMFGD
jgi:hypothetical protein